MDATETDGVSVIMRERERQRIREGYDDRHDDAHTDESLAQAAAVYAWPGRRPVNVKRAWPWDLYWFKLTLPDAEPVRCGCRSVGECDHRGTPSKAAITRARIHDLAKAGALIAAEIDRLQRSLPSEDA